MWNLGAMERVAREGDNFSSWTNSVLCRPNGSSRRSLPAWASSPRALPIRVAHGSRVGIPRLLPNAMVKAGPEIASTARLPAHAPGTLGSSSSPSASRALAEAVLFCAAAAGRRHQ